MNLLLDNLSISSFIFDMTDGANLLDNFFIGLFPN